MENVAAIDIGSNAIRLVIGEFDSDTRSLRLVRKLREPVRLGKDVFASGTISDKTLRDALEVFTKFQNLINAYSVKTIRAVATSALREAANQDAFVKRIKQDTGIAISVIDGLEEARLIHDAVAAHVNLNQKLAVLIDIGGGSVEVTLSRNSKMLASQSFELGTVRLLQKMEELKLKEKNLKFWIDSQMPMVQDFISKSTKGEKVDVCIGSGGNIESLGKLRVQLLDKDSTFSIKPKEINEIFNHLTSVPLKERIERFNMRPDRADVIVPASLVVLAILEILGSPRLLIPAVGLKDGILVDLLKNKNVRSMILT
jgi:exopolyphosphatase/guanosine-5'-triphosphate,3'-diphosphate pyrophosphatase